MNARGAWAAWTAAAVLAVAAAAAAAAPEPAWRAACLASAAAHPRAPADPELYDYAACSELVTGRAGLCDRFPGGPGSKDKPGQTYEVVRADGLVHHETLYGVCVSRAAGYRFLALLVDGAPEEQLRPQLRLMLYGEDVPLEDVLRTYVGAYRTGSLTGLARPDLVSVGFFNHVLGLDSCRSVSLSNMRRECLKKAAALDAYRSKDVSRCRDGDFLCKALVLGPDVCGEIEDRIVRRFCGAPAQPAPVGPAPAARRL
jgi:hypothetical protein